MPNVPVFRSYDRKGNLIKEVRKDVEFSMEAKKAIARYIYALIKEHERENEPVGI